MYIVTIKKRERGTPDHQEYKVEMPVIPRVSEFIESEILHFSGRVIDVYYLWPESAPLKIIVEIA